MVDGRKPISPSKPPELPKRKFVFGMFAGQFPEIPDSFFFDPLPDEWLGCAQSPASEPRKDAASMATVTIHEAKTQLSKLIARVEAGEEIVIARGKQPVAKLTALPRPHRRVFGALKGKYLVPPNSFFFDPLPEDELKAWEGGDEDAAR